jgi:hypothetical protein
LEAELVVPVTSASNDVVTEVADEALEVIEAALPTISPLE